MQPNKSLSISIPAELADAIRELAARERRNISQQMTILLEGAMRLRAPKATRAPAEEQPLLQAISAINDVTAAV